MTRDQERVQETADQAKASCLHHLNARRCGSVRHLRPIPEMRQARRSATQFTRKTGPDKTIGLFITVQLNRSIARPDLQTPDILNKKMSQMTASDA